MSALHSTIRLRLVPADRYAPGSYDVVVGHVCASPIYADLRQLGFYRDRPVVLDACRWALRRGRPVLRLRGPASTPAESARR